MYEAKCKCGFSPMHCGCPDRDPLPQSVPAARRIDIEKTIKKADDFLCNENYDGDDDFQDLAAEFADALLHVHSQLEQQQVPTSGTVGVEKIHPAVRELLCQFCQRDYPIWFAPDELWNRVVPDDAPVPISFLCLNCFALLAESRGIKPSAWALVEESKEAAFGKFAFEIRQLKDEVYELKSRLSLIESVTDEEVEDLIDDLVATQHSVEYSRTSSESRMAEKESDTIRQRLLDLYKARREGQDAIAKLLAEKTAECAARDTHVRRLMDECERLRNIINDR